MLITTLYKICHGDQIESDRIGSDWTQDLKPILSPLVPLRRERRIRAPALPRLPALAAGGTRVIIAVSAAIGGDFHDGHGPGGQGEYETGLIPRHDLLDVFLHDAAADGIGRVHRRGKIGQRGRGAGSDALEGYVEWDICLRSVVHGGFEDVRPRDGATPCDVEGRVECGAFHGQVLGDTGVR